MIYILPLVCNGHLTLEVVLMPLIELEFGLQKYQR